MWNVNKALIENEIKSEHCKPDMYIIRIQQKKEEQNEHIIHEIPLSQSTE